MAVASGLTGDLKKVVLELEDDLRERVHGDPDVLGRWQQEHQQAVSRERTAMSWHAWRDDRVTQAAVAWVLTTVFIRFCEDNGLLRPVWIAGPAERRQEALDAELEYFRAHPEHTDREWLLQAIEHLGSVKATRELVESHSPLWTVSPSGPAVKKLVSFWRAKSEDGALVHDFSDPDLSTRFLGDLYQDLSDYAKKTFALLQTPEFVEEFILDQTLEPALAERPLENFQLIDPTCGSGHFLLGAFHRLNQRWMNHAPGLEAQARAQKVFDAIHGVDVNPFAVAIAKFRLIVAATSTCELSSLEDGPGFIIPLAVGDSLLHGSHQYEFSFENFYADKHDDAYTYSSEDWALLQAILVPGSFDVVVGNPPYITVKDKVLNKRYRELYPSCKGTYAFTVPFMERFFDLASESQRDRPAGWIGQITSNSFMKREFGSKLIEDFLKHKDLRAVIDTSGAYIPGHGTPTLIVVGRNQAPVGSTVRAVLGVRGEPGQPKDASRGLVWSQIVEQIAAQHFDGEYVTVTDLNRSALAAHPWSLTGGGASSLVAALDSQRNRLKQKIQGKIGFASFPGADDAFFGPRHALRRQVSDTFVREVLTGDVVRDWSERTGESAFVPYDDDAQLIPLDESSAWFRRQWPLRAVLGGVARFGGETTTAAGAPWWGWYRWVRERYTTPLSIAFAEVSTHNHFVLDRGAKVFKQTAPVIKLAKEATEDDHFALLGVLNSSLACFWLKQKCHNKGSTVDTAGARQTTVPWEDFFQYNGTNISELPLPQRLPVKRAQSLDALARTMNDRLLSEAPSGGKVPTERQMELARAGIESSRARMIATQEELDWEVYQAYGLIDEDITYEGGVPELALGERAFEIALARKVAAGEEETAWFTRHGSTPITEIPSRWPEEYQQLVQRRLDLIESDKFIRLLEKPEHKRRWASQPWVKQVERALRGWLLDRLEDRQYWFDAQGRPAPTSVAQLADRVSRDTDLVSVIELWSGTKDQSVTALLTGLLADESVPFLAAHRLKDSGLRKREAWEHTWDLQRKEDAGEHVGDIPVPPKYTSADFRKHSWWQHRGKLDVPKERFILYPDSGRETDPTPVLGWAGWNHAQQALALATLIGARESEGWADERLVPLVAGLAELQPWVTQWHDEVDTNYGVNLAEFTAEHLRDKAAQLGVTLDELHAWRPAPSARGRRAKV
ncbi:BREX-2 system adenine-specific DNA-methyltransferase PglX [Rothia sp. ARF10]|nr:BREX-2 system adenine-specific DNA-methyltransferase PglX [Rothia sp. ARF10]